MAATTILEITKIEQSQAQKEVTANEAFDILDAAFGEKSIALTDANYTLSVVTHPKEFVWGVLRFTGALTGDRDIIVPLNKKPYTVVNDTTGGFSLVVKTAAGTGITVPNGATYLLRCDGTNVVQAGASVAAAIYDMAGSLAGVPGSDAVIFRFKFPRSVTFPVDMASSQGVASVAATAQTDFDLQKNGVSFGTMRYAAAGTTPTFIAASGASFAAGDILTVVAPNVPDGTLADISWTFAGERS